MVNPGLILSKRNRKLRGVKYWLKYSKLQLLGVYSNQASLPKFSSGSTFNSWRPKFHHSSPKSKFKNVNLPRSHWWWEKKIQQLAFCASPLIQTSFKHGKHKKNPQNSCSWCVFSMFYPCFIHVFSHRKPLHWGWTDESSGRPSASSIVRHHTLGPRRFVLVSRDRQDWSNKWGIRCDFNGDFYWRF